MDDWVVDDEGNIKLTPLLTYQLGVTANAIVVCQLRLGRSEAGTRTSDSIQFSLTTAEAFLLAEALVEIGTDPSKSEQLELLLH
ncbi:MAG: hypothetical protein JWM91_318 [Rhodospirillales bacterium]|nr:hypothetical protein [Rhodospirillales bacterium]